MKQSIKKTRTNVKLSLGESKKILCCHKINESQIKIKTSRVNRFASNVASIYLRVLTQTARGRNIHNTKRDEKMEKVLRFSMRDHRRVVTMGMSNGTKVSNRFHTSTKWPIKYHTNVPVHSSIGCGGTRWFFCDVFEIIQEWITQV